MKNFKVRKAPKPLAGALSFPGDKSLSHRAVMFGSLAEGVSEFTNVLEGEDCVCTRKAFEAMGVKIEHLGEGHIRVHGRGVRGLSAPKSELWLGNSGTSMRLLSGILAGQPFEAVLTGDPSLSSRPMRRVTDWLKQMGAVIEGRDGANYAPLTIRGGKLKPIDASLKVSSAQVKSAILLAGLYADGVTSVTEPVLSRDHTERFLKHFGAEVSVEGLKVSVRGGQKLSARSFAIGGDISSAAFFMVMAAIVPGSDLLLKDVLWNPTRRGIYEVMSRMGVRTRSKPSDAKGPETTVDVRFEYTTGLKPFEIKKEEIPSLVDEIPVLMVLATQAQGTSVVHDADELRVKESDRIATMTEGLTRMGAKIDVKGNTIYVHGPTPLKGAAIDTHLDHRVAMSHIVAGLVAEGETVVNDVECIDTSFPTFFKLLDSLGIKAG